MYNLRVNKKENPGKFRLFIRKARKNPGKFHPVNKC
jgi:hypothetical protein